MKVTKFEIVKVPPSWVWLFIHTDTDLVGIGEPYLEGHPEAVIAEVRRLEQAVVGQDPRRVETLWMRMHDAGFGYRGGPVTMSAISGIDMALWDLKGKALGAPVHELLGGPTRKSIPLYHATGGTRGPTSAPAGHRLSPGPEIGAGESAAELVQEWGYRAVKVHVHPGSGLEATGGVDRCAAVVAEVRAAVGSEVVLAVDVHNPHPVVAAQLAGQIADSKPLFIEEPVPLEAVESLTRVADHCPVPLAAGERWMGKEIFARALGTGALAVVQPDIAHAGGITECKKIAGLAEAAQASVALHCPLSPISLAASVQLDAAISNFLIQEHNEVNAQRIDGATVIGAGYLREPFVLDADGSVAVPPGAGLGVDLDRDSLEEIMSLPWTAIRA